MRNYICELCGAWWDKDLLKEGLCPQCRKKYNCADDSVEKSESYDTDLRPWWARNRKEIQTMKASTERESKGDQVNHPSHYTQHPSGVECIEITEHMPFNVGSAVKYLWRCDNKHPDPIMDLQKAEWYIKREIQRRLKVREQNGS